MQTLQELKEGKYLGSSSLKLNENLVSFPLEIFTLKETLEILDLSGNHLTSLPENLFELTKLKILFCSENNFSIFPKSIGQCESLDIVGFKSNKIEYIEETALPKSIRWLILTNNKITELPSNIGDCKRLQKLMLAGNQLKELPISLAKCRQLELIRLSANQLIEVPNWLLSLPKLAWIALAGNPCTQPSSSNYPVLEIDWRNLEVEHLLGSGASGFIYKAHLKTANLAVAIKIFKGNITSDGLPEDEMFNCLKAGQHENLVPILGKIINHPEQKNGLVLGLISPSYSNLGDPPNFITCTRDVFSKPKKISLEEGEKVVLKLAKVCAHLHHRGVMHGDFYAHNILINNDLDVILGDFGASTSYQVYPQQYSVFEKIEVRAFGYLIQDLIENFIYQPSSKLDKLRTWCLQEEVESRPSFNEILSIL